MLTIPVDAWPPVISALPKHLAPKGVDPKVKALEDRRRAKEAETDKELARDIAATG